MVAGTGRFDTQVTGAFRERVFVKTGAEGVHCAAIPELGYGIAVKCDDGARRAAEVIIASLVRRFLELDEEELALIEQFADAPLMNWNGLETGSIRPTEALTS